jgi:iron complex transport system permease protein
MMALSGIALAAMLDALLQTVLAKGTPDSLAVLAWLSGSSYRVTPARRWGSAWRFCCWPCWRSPASGY